jgi:hypothetical protein
VGRHGHAGTSADAARRPSGTRAVRAVSDAGSVFVAGWQRTRRGKRNPSETGRPVLVVVLAPVLDDRGASAKHETSHRRVAPYGSGRYLSDLTNRRRQEAVLGHSSSRATIQHVFPWGSGWALRGSDTPQWRSLDRREPVFPDESPGPASIFRLIHA